ncbi:MAG: hypothetical protein LBC73_03555 [Oscillospiraceae bacterium]|jgi:hypothetical protein|nr:hypothetical protein [Oscillospiraceae bacterium]
MTFKYKKIISFVSIVGLLLSLVPVIVLTTGAAVLNEAVCVDCAAEPVEVCSIHGIANQSGNDGASDTNKTEDRDDNNTNETENTGDTEDTKEADDTGLTIVDFSEEDMSINSIEIASAPHQITLPEEIFSIIGGGALPLDGDYILMNDIDLSGYSGGIGWTPIGVAGAEFTGTFDGNGYKITGLNINNPNNAIPYGLFGVVGAQGTIKNLGLVGGNVTVSHENHHYTGALVGILQGTMENCYSTSTVTGGKNVGGLVGAIEATGEIKNSYNTGTVSGVENVGGLVGAIEATGEIINSYNTGSVTGVNNVGGLVGAIEATGEILNSYNTGTVTGTLNVGGVAGENRGTIKNCYNTGRVTGIGDSIGGVVGNGFANSLVENCYNTGNVSGRSYVGGIIGSHENGSKTQNTISLGLTVTKTDTDIGRILGQNTNDASPTLSNNKARSDMLIGLAGSLAVPTEDIEANLKNGTDVVPGTATMASVFASAEGWDPAIWNIPTGNLLIHRALPTLRNMPGRIQNPIMPPYLVTVIPENNLITVTHSGNGIANANVQSSLPGETITLTAFPDPGYRFLTWEILSDGNVALSSETAMTTTFVMPNYAVSFNAVFEAIPNNIVDPNPQDFGTWTGSGDASATIDADFESFIQLSLDGKAVDTNNYSAKSGSTIITLYESYIETFDYGEYTFRAEFNDGFAYLTLIIYEEVPQTGDVSILLWLVLIIISGIGVVVALRYKERGSA